MTDQSRETRESAMLQRIDDARNGFQLIRDTGLEPRDMSDADKLRLEAAMHDLRDYERGVYDRVEVQEDLRRIADNLDDGTVPGYEDLVSTVLQWVAETWGVDSLAKADVDRLRKLFRLTGENPPPIG